MTLKTTKNIFFFGFDIKLYSHQQLVRKVVMLTTVLLSTINGNCAKDCLPLGEPMLVKALHNDVRQLWFCRVGVMF